ncbi:uncharacterized protein LOC129606460 [Condylostylus longicornis]|uniref:uncharacterized protein LOC129606460 n=1 Tax=Condylostylus longicornis TaxID=2530218 RepID=UPI00244DC0DE|nr:uncharacterized protein LOC129606460 [Condylostylus longicornis]
MSSFILIGIFLLSFLKLSMMQIWILDSFENEIKNKCMKEIGLNSTNSNELKNSSKSSKSTANSNQQYKCYLNCFLTGISFIRNKTIQEEVVISILSQRRIDVTPVKKAITTCNNNATGLGSTNDSGKSNSMDDCDLAFNLIKCLKSNIPNGYQKILL